MAKHNKQKQAEGAPPPHEGGHIGLVSRHVCLDTECFRRFGHSLNDPALKLLGEHFQTGRLSFHWTDLTGREISGQIREIAEKFHVALNRLRRTFRHWEERIPGMTFGKVEDVNKDQLVAKTLQAFGDTIKDWNPTIHKAMDHAARPIFDLYFGKKPPFDTAKTRKEFPDAFVIAALEKWCKENDEKMYVISKDEAFKRAAIATGVLIPLNTVEELLERIAQAELPEVIEKARLLFQSPQLLRNFESVITEDVEQLAASYTGDYRNGDPVGVELVDVLKVGEFWVIGQTESTIEAVLDLVIRVNITLDYEDTSLATYDNESHSYIGSETAQVEFDDVAIMTIYALINVATMEVVRFEPMTEEIEVQEEVETYK